MGTKDKINHSVEEAIDRSSSMTEEELAYCAAYADGMKKLLGLVDRNAKLRHNMGAEFGIQLEPVSMLKMYVELALDKLYPPDTIERLEFEIEFQKQVLKSQEGGVAEAKRKRVDQKLGIKRDGGLIVPGGR
jgi:hypothetical protein